uniref:Uncharacterized protein n=1 Tax=Oryza barthii TaxID=65489 RepID=A0A0D3H4J2_9ORYZ
MFICNVDISVIKTFFALLMLIAHVRDTIICNHLAIDVKCGLQKKHIAVVADDISDETFIELQGSHLPGRNKYNKIYKKRSNWCTTKQLKLLHLLGTWGANFLN